MPMSGSALMDLSGLLASAYDFHDEHLDGLRKHLPTDDNAYLQLTRVHLTPSVTLMSASALSLGRSVPLSDN